MRGWNQYLIEDARNLGNVLDDARVLDVTLTSPPYWDIKNYGTSNQIGYKQTLDSYLSDIVSVFTEVWKRTKKTGSLWIVIKSVKKDGRLHLLPLKLAEQLTTQPKHSWHLQDVLIWHKPHTLPWSHKQKLQDNYECILCLSKSRNFTLNIDAVRSPDSVANWWVKYPERYHPLGKAISNVWEIPIPTQGSWGNGNLDHSCPLPAELARRVILLATPKNGTVFDPFAGTGTTPLAAAQLSRRWLAFDVNSKYRDMFHRRLATECPTAARCNSRRQRVLSSANLHLRQLKYAILLYKRVAPALRLTSTKLPLIVVFSGELQKAPNPHWVEGTRLFFLFAKEPGGRSMRHLRNVISAECRSAPLSKFQIEAHVEIAALEATETSRFFRGRTPLFLYTKGVFWKAEREIDAKAVPLLVNGTKLPNIVSDLRTNEQPAY